MQEERNGKKHYSKEDKEGEEKMKERDEEEKMKEEKR